MNEQQETRPNGRGMPEWANWLIPLIVLPPSLVSYAVWLGMGRRGFNRLTLASISAVMLVFGCLLMMVSGGPVTYVEAVKGLLPGAAAVGAPGPGMVLIISVAVLSIGWGGLVAASENTAWRKRHASIPDWAATHIEKPSFLNSLRQRREVKAKTQSNDDAMWAIEHGEYLGDKGVGLGYLVKEFEETGEIVPVGLPDIVGGSVNHNLLIGSTGTGKSQTLARMAHDGIKNGDPILLIDAKGDGSLAESLGAYAQEYDRPFYHFSIPIEQGHYFGPSEWGRAFYDPAGLRTGNYTRRRDFMMDARDWTGAAAVYPDKTRDYLARALWVDEVVAELCGGVPGYGMPDATFSRIAELMSPITLKKYLKDAIAEHGAHAVDMGLKTTTSTTLLTEIEEYAIQRDPTGESARLSHAAWLRTFMASVVGPYLRDTRDYRTIRIPDMVDQKAVCVFDLATDQYRQEAPAIARLVIADLLSYISSAGKSSGMRLRVLIDEFAAIGGDDAAGVLARARSTGVAMTLATQTLSDLREVSEAFEGQVLANSRNILVHNASTWEEAEKFSGMTGRIKVERESTSERADGALMVNRSIEERNRVEPGEFMEMSVGELIRISGGMGGEDKAVKIQVVMAPRVHADMFAVNDQGQAEVATEVDVEVEYVPEVATEVGPFAAVDFNIPDEAAREVLGPVEPPLAVEVEDVPIEAPMAAPESPQPSLYTLDLGDGLVNGPSEAPVEAHRAPVEPEVTLPQTTVPDASPEPSVGLESPSLLGGGNLPPRPKRVLRPRQPGV